LELLLKAGNALAGKEKTGADGRDRSLLSERGSFAYYRKVPSECRYYSPFCLIFQGK